MRDKILGSSEIVILSLRIETQTSRLSFLPQKQSREVVSKELGTFDAFVPHVSRIQLPQRLTRNRSRRRHDGFDAATLNVSYRTVWEFRPLRVTRTTIAGSSIRRRLIFWANNKRPSSEGAECGLPGRCGIPTEENVDIIFLEAVTGRRGRLLSLAAGRRL